MSRAERRAMVERVSPVLPVSQQCRLLAVSRSAVYREAATVSAEDLAIMALIAFVPKRSYEGGRWVLRLRLPRTTHGSGNNGKHSRQCQVEDDDLCRNRAQQEELGRCHRSS